MCTWAVNDTRCEGNVKENKKDISRFVIRITQSPIMMMTNDKFISKITIIHSKWRREKYIYNFHTLDPFDNTSRKYVLFKLLATNQIKPDNCFLLLTRVLRATFGPSFFTRILLHRPRLSILIFLPILSTRKHSMNILGLRIYHETFYVLVHVFCAVFCIIHMQYQY